MDEFTSRRSGLVNTRKSPGLVPRDSSESPRDRNVQGCSRAGCSSKLNPIKSSHSQIGSPIKKDKASKIPFRPPGISKEIIESSSKTANTSRKPISDLKRSKLHSQNSEPEGVSKSVASESSNSESNNRLVNRNSKNVIRCTSISDIVSSSSTETTPTGKRRDIGRKIVSEPESCVSALGRITGTTMDDKRTENSSRGISICDSRRTRNISSIDNNQRSIGNRENGRRLPMIESSLQTPSPTQPEMSLGSMASTSAYESGVASSDYMNRGALRQYNLDGIAELLLALERIEQEEEPSYEQLLVLETNLFLGGLTLHDQHRDMRLNIDNMSYEELLALEDRIGNVSTGVPEKDLIICVKRTTFKGIHQCRENENENESENGVKCSICQEEYEEGDEVGRVKCEHSYHLECINNWLRLKNWCPVCKESVLPSTSLS